MTILDTWEVNICYSSSIAVEFVSYFGLLGICLLVWDFGFCLVGWFCLLVCFRRSWNQFGLVWIFLSCRCVICTFLCPMVFILWGFNESCILISVGCENWWPARIFTWNGRWSMIHDKELVNFLLIHATLSCYVLCREKNVRLTHKNYYCLLTVCFLNCIICLYLV